MIKFLAIVGFSILSIKSFSQSKEIVESIVTNNVNSDLQKTSDEFVNELINNDNSKIEILASEQLKKIEPNLLEKLKLPANAKSKYLLNQKFIKNSQEKTPTQLLYKFPNDEIFMKFIAEDKISQIFQYVIVYEDKEVLLNLVWGQKNNSIWKINIVQFGELSLYTRNAKDYFEIAKQKFNTNNLVDALFNIEFAKTCSNPAASYGILKSTESINTLYSKITTTFKKKYSFPIVLSQIKTNPELVKVYPDMYSDNFYTRVDYLTKINIDNIEDLKSENEQIKKEIKILFPNIKNEKPLLFRAYTSPEDINNPKAISYGFVDK